MHSSFHRLATLSLCALSPVVADYLGPRWVPPTDLTSNNSKVATAWKNATSMLEAALSDSSANSTSGGITGLQDVTFSAGMFSLHDPAASKLQFHHTSPEIEASNGTHKVDGDSIYRVASITKVFTVLSMLLNLKPEQWEMSMVEVFPGLADFAKAHPGVEDPANVIQWEDVTFSNLAAQIAGLPTNLLVSDLAVGALLRGEDPTLSGYPWTDVTKPELEYAIPALEQFYVEDLGVLTEDNFVPTLYASLPNFSPWGNAQYSNNGFVLLTAAIAKVTGESVATLAQKSILDPLGMISSYYDVIDPSLNARSVVVNDAEWAASGGIAIGSGGLVSTIHDLQKFGLGVLNSTLLPEVETRRWLKPVSNTARFEYQMGRPWEILRYTHASGAVTDLYTKAGDSGSYSSYLVLIPDYNAGFVILGGSSSEYKNPVIGIVSDLIANSVLPALEEQATTEAEKNFAGVYTSSVEGLNSSVTLCINKTENAAPGLWIKNLIANGTQFSHPYYYREGSRLTPSIFSAKTGEIAFRIALGLDMPSKDVIKSLFSGAGTANFLVGDAAQYGGASITQWVMNVNDKGEADSVTPTFLQDTWKKGSEKIESC